MHIYVGGAMYASETWDTGRVYTDVLRLDPGIENSIPSLNWGNHKND